MLGRGCRLAAKAADLLQEVLGLHVGGVVQVEGALVVPELAHEPLDLFGCGHGVVRHQDPEPDLACAQLLVDLGVVPGHEADPPELLEGGAEAFRMNGLRHVDHHGLGLLGLGVVRHRFGVPSLVPRV